MAIINSQNLAKITRPSINSWFILRRLKSANLDVLDTFIVNLCDKQSLRWKQHEDKFLKTKQQMMKSSAQKHAVARLDQEEGFNVPKWDQVNIDSSLIIGLRKNDCEFLDAVIEICLSHGRLPSDEIFLQLLHHLFHLEDHEIINKLVKLCRLTNPSYYKTSEDLAPYVAHSIWLSGDSEQGLAILRKCFLGDNPNIKSLTREMYRVVVEDAIKNRSEAVIVKITADAVHIYETAADAVVLAFIWKCCFISAWFSEQQRANQLFESYADLRNNISCRVSVFCYSLLKSHNVDAVQRLIQQVKFSKSGSFQHIDDFVQLILVFGC